MITATVSSTDLLNLDYLKASKLILPVGDSINLILVGCGGTGSWLAPAVVRIARLLIEKFAKSVSVHFVDPDVVEAKNVFRQNFCQAEIGRNKADTLAFRYGLAWGIDVTAWSKPLRDVRIEGEYNATHILIGCVDRSSARAEIRSYSTRHVSWWLDCGNFNSAGQVVLGYSAHHPKDPFQLPGFCSWLPLPSDQHPELIDIPAVESAYIENPNLSCADLAMLDSQGMSINQRIAAEAADYLVRLLLSKDLNRFATYLDLASGSSRSLYITPENLEAYYV